MIVKYEDIASYPEKVNFSLLSLNSFFQQKFQFAKAILNFVEMDYTREVDAWIFENTHDEEKNTSMLNFDTSHKSKILIDKWKTDLAIV